MKGIVYPTSFRYVGRLSFFHLLMRPRNRQMELLAVKFYRCGILELSVHAVMKTPIMERASRETVVKMPSESELSLSLDIIMRCTTI